MKTKCTFIILGLITLASSIPCIVYYIITGDSNSTQSSIFASIFGVAAFGLAFLIGPRIDRRSAKIYAQTSPDEQKKTIWGRFIVFLVLGVFLIGSGVFEINTFNSDVHLHTMGLLRGLFALSLGFFAIILALSEYFHTRAIL